MKFPLLIQVNFYILYIAALLNNLFIHFFERGGSGADIGPLKTSMNVLSGLKPDSQRYFDHHHSASDNFDAINITLGLPFLRIGVPLSTLIS